MAKILLLVLAMASGILAQECAAGELFADMAIEAYDLKVVNHANRPVRVEADMPDLEVSQYVGVTESTHWGGLKMGKWRLTVIQYQDTDDLDEQYATVGRRLIFLKRQGPEFPNLEVEIAQLEEQIRGLQRQMKAREQEVASCSGEFVWNKDDVHLRDTVTITREGGAWKLSC